MSPSRTRSEHGLSLKRRFKDPGFVVSVLVHVGALAATLVAFSHNEKFDDLQERLDPEPLYRLVASWEYTLENRGRHLDSLSYHKILERGFAVVRDRHGKVVDRRTKLPADRAISIEFNDGKIDAEAVKR